MRRSRLSLRGRLIALVVAMLAPLLALSLLNTFLHYRTRQDDISRETLHVARSMAQAVEADHRARLAGLQALALSPFLQSGDLSAFRRQAEAFLSTQPVGATLGLADVTGQLLLAAGAVPSSGQLPKRRNMAALEAVFRTAKPVVSNLFTNALTGTHSYTLDVPVLRDGAAIYDLGIDPTPACPARRALGSRALRSDDHPQQLWLDTHVLNNKSTRHDHRGAERPSHEVIPCWKSPHPESRLHQK